MKESILPDKESEVEKDQMKEIWISKEGLATSLMMKKRVQQEEVTPRKWEKWYKYLENRIRRGRRHKLISPSQDHRN